MKLRNKEDKSKIGTLKVFYLSPYNEVGKLAVESSGTTYYYDSLGKVYAEWEDYEEPKTYWMIDTSTLALVREIEGQPYEIDKQIGNYFETEEEAEKAVEKLKAWKRLKDKGFEFCGNDDRDRGRIGDIVIYAEMPTIEYDDDSTRDDLDLLFGGEE